MSVQLNMATLPNLPTKSSVARLAGREAASPDQIRLLQATSPWFTDYLLGRRRRGVHVLGTRWEELLL